MTTGWRDKNNLQTNCLCIHVNSIMLVLDEVGSGQTHIRISQLVLDRCEETRDRSSQHSRVLNTISLLPTMCTKHMSPRSLHISFSICVSRGDVCNVPFAIDSLQRNSAFNGPCPRYKFSARCPRAWFLSSLVSFMRRDKLISVLLQEPQRQARMLRLVVPM